jgi:carboxypeptidase Taq
MKIKNKVIKDILLKYRKIDSLKRLISLAEWDLNVYMPSKANEERSIIISEAEIQIKNLILDKEFVDLIKKAEKEHLNIYEKSIIKILKKEIERLKKLPNDFIEEFSKISNQAQFFWRRAKNENDFNIFKPYLRKIISLVKKEADYLGYENHPYDALIDLYEEGWRTEDFLSFFSLIKPPLKNIFSKALESKYCFKKHPLENERYKKEDMENLNIEVLKILNFDSERSRIDISAHPFEQAISLNDVRITTWYHQKDFKRSLTATVHEFGHLLYESNIDPDFKFTPLQGGVSCAFHESQSRFWENIILKNNVFLKKIWKIAFKKLSFLKKYSFEDFLIYFNQIKPSLIRVEADEISYHFHIILRFEIEKMLLEDKIKVEELPEYWNEKMKEYLGLRVNSYKEGILQDIHWSMGAFGYFPTYSLGSFLSGFWLKKIQEELGSINDILDEKEGVLVIQNWFKEKIYKFGKVYSSKDLIYKIGKEKFNHIYFLSYLEDKYLSYK